MFPETVTFEGKDLDSIRNQVEKALNCMHCFQRKLCKEDTREESKLKKQKEMAVVMLSTILKNIVEDQYLPVPMGTEFTEDQKPYFKDLAIKGVLLGMKELSKDLKLGEGMKHALILYEDDLERKEGKEAVEKLRQLLNSNFEKEVEISMDYDICLSKQVKKE